MTRFDGRTAVITGGARGIGRAVAEHFAAEGARVLITGRDAARVAQAAREIEGEVIFLPGDIADAGTPQGIVDCAMEHWGRIDVLVNNAGLHDQSGFLEQTKEDWDYVLGVVLTGPYFLAQKCARVMVTQGRGSIINVGSIDANGYDGPVPAYGAAKAGLVNVTRYMAVVLGPHGVRANSISPGVVATTWAESMPELYEDLSRHLSEGRVPLRRMIKPKEIAEVVGFLASDDASAITGADFLVDAGLLADLAAMPAGGS